MRYGWYWMQQAHNSTSRTKSQFIKTIKAVYTTGFNLVILVFLKGILWRRNISNTWRLNPMVDSLNMVVFSFCTRHIISWPAKWLWASDDSLRWSSLEISYVMYTKGTVMPVKSESESELFYNWRSGGEKVLYVKIDINIHQSRVHMLIRQCLNS
jgi:hypothetical protein